MQHNHITGIAAIGLLAAAGALAAGGDAAAPAEKPAGRLLVYCAAGVREPVQAIAARFEAATGVKVELTFANSGQLLGQIETTRQGDVYVPGDIGFARQAEERKLTADAPATFCYFVPAILVRKGNPRDIRTVADLARPGLKLALADPSAAIGALQARLFKTNAVAEKALAANAAVAPATVTDVALAVKLGTVDAAIVWDAVARMYAADTDIVAIPADRNVIGTVAACRLTVTRNPLAAQAFLDFLTSAEARAILKAKGFATDRPRGEATTGAGAAETVLLVHVGGTMRPAMDELCRVFTAETAIRTEMNYNDSGALLTAIETTRKGDLDAIAIDPTVLPEQGVDAVTSATFGPIDMSLIRVTWTTLKTAAHPDAARRLADFAVSDRGQAIFAAYGFSPAPGAVTGR